MKRTRKTPTDRRAELISATAAVMLEQGFGAATTRDVTGRVGVGSGLLNHYFSWDELRRLGFEAVAQAGTNATFPSARNVNPLRTMRRLVREAFSRFADPYWRVWVEAIDAAASDPELAAVVGRCAEDFRIQLEALLKEGNDVGAWICADPSGAAWRILAIHDGLVGFLFGGAPPLSRRAATRHFRIAVGNELEGKSRL